MISTPLRSSKILSHTRSASLPSRSHPLIPQFNDHLHRLNHSFAPSSISLSSIINKLHSLDHLYNCVDDLLLLPHTRQVFARESNEKWVDEILDGYLGLVDACSTAKDHVFHAKEFVLDLLSVLRRRRDSDDHLCGFLASRKVARKMIHRSLTIISSHKNKPSVVALDKDEETIAIVSMLKEAESTTVDVIESLLLSIAGQSRPSGWSLVSRLMHPRKTTNSGRETAEFGEMDAKLVGFRTSRGHVDELQQQLRVIDASIEDVEETIERLFKRLIKTRVSLLNMHSH